MSDLLLIDREELCSVLAQKRPYLGNTGVINGAIIASFLNFVIAISCVLVLLYGDFSLEIYYVLLIAAMLCSVMSFYAVKNYLDFKQLDHSLLTKDILSLNKNEIVSSSAIIRNSKNQVLVDMSATNNPFIELPSKENCENLEEKIGEILSDKFGCTLGKVAKKVQTSISLENSSANRVCFFMVEISDKLISKIASNTLKWVDITCLDAITDINHRDINTYVDVVKRFLK